MPPKTEILDAFPTFDYNIYLTEYVGKAAPVNKNFFYEARGVVWQSTIVDKVTGNIGEVDCPEDATPKAMASSASVPGMLRFTLLMRLYTYRSLTIESH